MSGSEYDYQGEAEIGGPGASRSTLGVVGINRNTWIGHVAGRESSLLDGLVVVTLLEGVFADWTALAAVTRSRDDCVELRGRSVFRPSLPAY
jgi:hypothetical protein